MSRSDPDPVLDTFMEMARSWKAHWGSEDCPALVVFYRGGLPVARVGVPIQYDDDQDPQEAVIPLLGIAYTGTRRFRADRTIVVCDARIVIATDRDDPGEEVTDCLTVVSVEREGTLRAFAQPYLMTDGPLWDEMPAVALDESDEAVLPRCLHDAMAAGSEGYDTDTKDAPLDEHSREVLADTLAAMVLSHLNDGALVELSFPDVADAELSARMARAMAPDPSAN